MEPLNQLSDLVRSRLGDAPSGCTIRRIMVIVDRGMMIRSNGPKAFASIDFGFDVGTAPDEHNSVRDSPPPIFRTTAKSSAYVWRSQQQHDLKRGT